MYGIRAGDGMGWDGMGWDEMCPCSFVVVLVSVFVSNQWPPLSREWIPQYSYSVLR